MRTAVCDFHCEGSVIQESHLVRSLWRNGPHSCDPWWSRSRSLSVGPNKCHISCCSLQSGIMPSQIGSHVITYDKLCGDLEQDNAADDSKTPNLLVNPKPQTPGQKLRAQDLMGMKEWTRKKGTATIDVDP